MDEKIRTALIYLIILIVLITLLINGYQLFYGKM